MIYLHVGLHKTGTTFFQSEVFPKWPGVTYIRRPSIENFLKIGSDGNYLASREGFSGGVLAPRSEKLAFLERLSKMFPDARIIISFRRHASYINAIYSQYLRYGGTLKLEEFFDLHNDTGFIKQEDVYFEEYVSAASRYWNRKPFVFLLSELKDNQDSLLDDLGRFLGAAPPSGNALSKQRRNVSLGQRQAEVLRRINSFAGVELHRDGSTRPYRMLRRFKLDPPTLCQKWAGLGPTPPIMDPALAQEIDRHYQADWSFLQDCVGQRRTLNTCKSA